MKLKTLATIGVICVVLIVFPLPFSPHEQFAAPVADRVRPFWRLRIPTVFPTVPFYAMIMDGNMQQTTQHLHRIVPFLDIHDWTIRHPVSPPFFACLPQFLNTRMQARYPTLQFVANLFNENVTMITHDAYGWSEWKDLWWSQRNPIHIGYHKSHYGHEWLENMVKQLKPPQHQRVQLHPFQHYQQMYDAWSDDQLDIMYLFSTHPNSFLHIMSTTFRIRLLNLDTLLSQNPKLQYAYPDLIQDSVPLVRCPGRTETQRNLPCSEYNLHPVDDRWHHPTVGFRLNIVATKNVSACAVNECIAAIHTNLEHLKRELPWFRSVFVDRMMFCPDYMQYHAGARQYYAQHNLGVAVTTDPKRPRSY